MIAQTKSALQSGSKRLHRPWSVRTVVIRLSRKLTATYRIRSERSLSRLLAALLAVVSPLAMAELPTGLNVVAGQATASTPTANNMRVNQATDKAVLNWQSFSIGVGKSVQFVQPSTSSVALNRVVGSEASSIYGSLSANGQVFLINPAGVMFAPGAQVNVGGLVASSLAISNEDFMAGRYTFSGVNGGPVDNNGTIKAAPRGYVLLAAPKVGNAGTIQADAGSIGLLAGSRATIDTSGTGLVRFFVDAAAANAAVVNSGKLLADGGQVALLASAVGDAMATVINQSGVIRANSAQERNGMIVLSGGQTGVVKVSGTLSAAGTSSGQTGGTVHVLGDKVLLAAGASIDASGQSGGGTVLVGGDYQGSNGSVQNASRVHAAADTSVNADAASSGNGGKVVIWADGDTRFAGSISARGGAAGGDGGFVEVSGKHQLDVQGSVDLTANKGKGGTLLFDPTDITIGAVAGTVPPNNVGLPDVAFADVPASYVIQVTPALRGYSELWLQANNNITLNTALAMNLGNAVRFEAKNSININAAITASGGITLNSANGTISSTAAGTLTSTGAPNANAGNISVTAAGNVSLLGAITATGGAAGAGLTGNTGGTVGITGAGGVTVCAD
jgi:filamentous hemagglutinin family protein